MNTRVLIVDDEDNVLDAFRRQYGRHYEVHSASDAWEALQILEDHGPFAVVVSDWKMPKIDGVQFLGEVMRRAPETSRIMLTGHAAHHLAVDAVNRGYLFRFHSKPCDSVELFHSIQDGVERFQATSIGA